MKYKVGDLVTKNPATWVPNEFDTWSMPRGEGVGIVKAISYEDVDVKWPGGRCYESPEQLLNLYEEKERN